MRMRRVLIALCLSFLVGAASAAVPAPEVVKVNERVYALLGPMEMPNAKNRGYMVNSTVILGETGVILIDTGFTDEIGKRLREEIARITSKPVTHVINTHHHGDHSLGNTAFPEAEVLSAEMCKQLVEQTGWEWVEMVEGMTGMKFPDTKPVPASVTYAPESRTEVTLQGVRMSMWVPKGSHTEGDMMVYLPDDQVLVAGDILVNEITPNFRDGKVAQWIDTLEEVSALDAETIIPGHGPLMDKDEAAAMQQRMAALYAGVEEAYLDGAMSSDIRARVDLSEWERLLHFEENMGGNISRTYLEVEEANF